ncbi:hypothetical protein AAFF_G00261020 [Aldrovandia affinis]|uniref:Uncharacterized protein n=1 Tax=Aldrovandia affinis TaxID=143900 RepID=A0AAD7RCG7_9TELE|nr:hypothetical protein AAFF_G00261020 [Aldrovandia affinis]
MWQSLRHPPSVSDKQCPGDGLGGGRSPGTERLHRRLALAVLRAAEGEHRGCARALRRLTGIRKQGAASLPCPVAVSSTNRTGTPACEDDRLHIS